MELAMWADIRVMEDTAFMGVYCRRWGIPLIDGGTVRLPRLVGEGRAMDLILTGRRVDAEEALAIGLSARAQHGLGERDALRQEWRGSKAEVSLGIAGAARFAAGRGRGGDFDDI